MLGPKGILTPTDAYELLRCEAAPAILHHHFIAGKRHEYAAHRALQPLADWILMTLYERLPVSA